jgi:hypothetical protein
MAYKAIDSFLRFITMGAIATRHMIHLLEQRGYQMIELERYASSNKVWQTKVKRLRLPDLMCVRTGIRFEVRAKSNLKIEMSHAPGNPDRYWDAGLRDRDVVVLVKAYEDQGKIRLGNQINAFHVSTLRTCQNIARVGGIKASSEGSERTITWPAWVPSADGVMDNVVHNPAGTIERVRVRYDDGRAYTYSHMEDKHVYVPEGQRFVGNEQFVLGLPNEMATLIANETEWVPANDFDSDELSDRFAAVKAYMRLDPAPVIDRLRHILSDDKEDLRIRLEAAGVLARHGLDQGLIFLSNYALSAETDAAWIMEAVLILSELSDRPDVVDVLCSILANSQHAEARAAAAWGLGNTAEALPTLLNYLNDPDMDVAKHAVIAASRLVVDTATTQAVCQFFSLDERLAASASEVLARAQEPDVSVLLNYADADASDTIKKWAFATLARRNANKIRLHPQWHSHGDQLRHALESAWFGPEHSWLVDNDVAVELNSLELQKL